MERGARTTSSSEADAVRRPAGIHTIVVSSNGKVRAISPFLRDRLGRFPGGDASWIRPHTEPGRFDLVHREGRKIVATGTRIEVDDEPSASTLFLLRLDEDVYDRRPLGRLADSDDKYRALVELSPDLIAIVVDGIVRFINPAGAHLLGVRSREAILGRNFAEFIDPVAGDAFVGTLRSIADGEMVTRLPNLTLLDRKGERIEVEVNAVPFAYKGDPAALLTIRDFSRPRSDWSAPAPIPLLASTLEASGEAIMITDRNGEIVSFNRRFLNMWRGEASTFKRFSHQDFLRHACALVKSPDEFTSRLETLLAIDDDAVDVIELRDGRVLERRSMVRRVDAEVAGRVWSYTDQTDRRTSDEALRRRDYVLHAVAFAAERFLMSSVTSANVNDVLQRFGQAADVSRVYIFEVLATPDGRTIARETAEWVADGVRPLIGMPEIQALDIYDRFRRWFELLSNGEILDGTIMTFPEDERKFLEAFDVKSLLTVPIFVEGDFWGAIGFDDVREPRLWSHVEIEALKTAADILGAAVQRQVSEEALRNSEWRYRQLFERNLAGVYRSTFDGRILDCNEAAARIFGFATREEALQVPATSVYFDASERDAIIKRLQQHGSLTNLEISYQRRDGSTVWVLENIALVEGHNGESSTMEGTLIDITDRKTAEQLIEYQAYHDALTGLPNRLLFRDRLMMAIAQAKRSDRHLAVMFLDIDHFKVINDTLGHTVGDALLRAVADRLRFQLREEDSVARLGGDEFTMLLADLQDDDYAISIAQRILDSFAEPFDVETQRFYVTASIGIALRPVDGDDADTLLKNADNAMYRAKEMGRNNFQLCSPMIVQQAAGRLTMENDLRKALSGNELEIYIQPQFDVQYETLIGGELLLRWNHPEHGQIPPTLFIPVAEETRLIHPIGEHVLEQACLLLEKWKELWPRARLSVNLSARQFQQPDLVGVIQRTILSSGISPSAIELEITETAAMQNVERSLITLRELSDMGLSLAIDDFGKGHSSLSYIQRFPIDTLKIDQSFVAGLPHRTESEAIVAAILTMARGLRLRAIAEGVEEAAQLDVLRRLGCQLVQGFMFGRPMPVAKFEEMLAARGRMG